MIFRWRGALRIVGLIIWPTCCGNQGSHLVKSRLVPRGLAGSLLLTYWGTRALPVQSLISGHISLIPFYSLVHLLGRKGAISFSHFRVQHMFDLFLHPIQRDLILQSPELAFRELIFPILGQIAHRGANSNKEVDGSLVRLLAEVLDHVPLFSKSEGTTIVFPQHLKKGH